MRRRRATPSLLLLSSLLLAGRPIALGAEGDPGWTEGQRSLPETVAELERTLAAIETNLREQERAWPTREEDLLRERPVPYEVRMLQRDHEALLATRAELEGALAAEDLGPLLDEIRNAQDASLLESLVRVALRRGREDYRTLKELVALARRLDACPPFLVEALGDLRREESSFLLLELGEREEDPTILYQAGLCGKPSVVGSLIDMAEGPEPSLADAALLAIARLEPPSVEEQRRLRVSDLPDPEQGDPESRAKRLLVTMEARSRSSQELEDLILQRIRRTGNPDLKAALVVYLGLFREPDHLGFLTELYAGSPGDERLRLAAIGALGNLGISAADFLVQELLDARNSWALRRSCIHALGVSRGRAAVPYLIDLLAEPRLGPDATRALERIAGRSAGDSEAAWVRWWRAQPEASHNAQPLPPE